MSLYLLVVHYYFSAQARFAGDNFFRYSGEAPEVQQLQLFAWQAAARGNDVHLNANPTQGELLHHEFKQRKEELKDTSKVSILAKYGGAEYLETAPKELREGQTEDYVEYSRTGQVIKGRERAKAKSKYPEDGEYFEIQAAIIAHFLAVYINNHTAVWGSWFDISSATWGYACCHSVIHVSYCSGMAGIEAAQASTAQSLLSSTIVPVSSSSSGQANNESRAVLVEKVEQNYSKKRVGEGDVKLDEERLAQAMNEEKKRKFGMDGDNDMPGKKRKNTSYGGGSHDVTEEELGVFLASIVGHFY